MLLQGGEVYKRLRSQVRGSQRRLCRCLRSALKPVLVPCTYEHNIISYIIFQLCDDVLCAQIKSTGNGLAQSGVEGCTLQYSQSHRDYLTQGSYYLIVAQIDYCLVLLKLMFMLCSCTKGVSPTLGPLLCLGKPYLMPFLIRKIPHFSHTIEKIFLSLDPLLFVYNLTKLSEAGFHHRVFGKVGAGVRLRHILCLRSSLKTDRAVCKNSPTRYIVE